MGHSKHGDNGNIKNKQETHFKQSNYANKVEFKSQML